VRATRLSPTRLLLAALASHFFLIGPQAFALSVTWDGGGADDRFDTPENWSGDLAPASGSTTDLYFAGPLRLTPSNTFSAGSDLGSIIFDAGAGAFNVGGSGINLYGRIENNSTTTQTVSLSSLSLTSTSEFRVPTGNLTIALTGAGPNILNNGNTVNVYGDNNKLLTFAAGTVISGSGGFRIREFSTVLFQSAQTYTGATYIDSGRLFTGGTIGNNTSAIFLGSSQAAYADTTANLFIENSGLNMANPITTSKADNGTSRGFGGRLIDGTFTSGTSTLSGGIEVNGGLTISQSTGGTLKVSGVVRDGTEVGNVSRNVSIGLGTAVRGGVVQFTAGNTYTGTTSVTSGTLELNNDGSATNGRIGGTTAISVTRNSTLLLSGSSVVRDRINNSSTLVLGQSTIAGTGGTLNTGGLSEGTAPTGPGGVGGVVGIGALSLRANTTIDFTAANGGSALVFQSLSFVSGTVANITHWTGPAGANGLDHLLFAINPNLTANDLRLVQFTNDAGTNFATGGLIVDYNGYYELVPITAVPEPATWVGATLALLSVGFARIGKRAGPRLWTNVGSGRSACLARSASREV
jgi:autotransporter-associated beta strand protein